MSAIKITAAFAQQLETHPWILINAGCAVLCYKSRQEARDAKKHGFQGILKNKSEVEFEVVQPVAEVPVAQQTFPLADLTKFGENLNGEVCCPKCGSTEVFDGEGSDVGVINEDVIHGCHSCGWEVDDRKNRQSQPVKAPKTSNGPILHKSEIDHPCKRVWGIASDMKAANPNVKRGAVLAACVAQGIAYYTARTQYQQWLGIQKEMAQREASQKQG